MEKLTVIRKRLIPLEEVDISGDEQISFDGKLLVTRWFPIKPRKDVGWGISHTYLDAGFKVSAFFDRTGSFRYWYWDVIDAVYLAEERKLIVTDLLVDVIVDSRLQARVLDREELTQALVLGLLDETAALRAERILKEILRRVSGGDFPLREAPSGKYEPPKGFVPVKSDAAE